ncbi:MAG: hypothetical protein WAV89_01640 [Ignavibacteriaceae bacterium]
METYIIKLSNSITLEKSNEDYINECCQDCDVLLNLIKPDIIKEFQITDIEIGQEDWGWYLIFIKDNLNYNLHLSFNIEQPELSEFLFYCFVNKVEKKFLFSKKTEVLEETHNFEERIKLILKKFGSISANN